MSSTASCRDCEWASIVQPSDPARRYCPLCGGDVKITTEYEDPEDTKSDTV